MSKRVAFWGHDMSSIGTVGRRGTCLTSCTRWSYSHRFLTFIFGTGARAEVMPDDSIWRLLKSKYIWQGAEAFVHVVFNSKKSNIESSLYTVLSECSMANSKICFLPSCNPIHSMSQSKTHAQSQWKSGHETTYADSSSIITSLQNQSIVAQFEQVGFFFWLHGCSTTRSTCRPLTRVQENPRECNYNDTMHQHRNQPRKFCAQDITQQPQQ